MPSTEATFAIGAIREREKGFLTEEQYLRLIEAPTISNAIQVLNETPYGKWFEVTAPLAFVLSALEKSVKEELDWITDVVDRPKLIQFIKARYDALNCANVIIAANHGRTDMPHLSELGSLEPEHIFSAVWNNMDWDKIPSEWQAILKMKGARISEVLAASTAAWLKVLEKNAITPLSHFLIKWHQDRLTEDTKIQHAIEADQKGSLNLSSATLYEREWDNKMIAEIQKYRHDPTGYDPILAHYLAKENEARVIRLLLVAKAGGVSTEELHALRRTSYTARP